MMNKTNTKTRKAIAGHCADCGQRVVRGRDQDGQLVTVTVRDLGPADELRAFTEHGATFRLEWVGHMQIDRRTTHDLVIDPAGFREGRIYAEHHCTPTTQPTGARP